MKRIAFILCILFSCFSVFAFTPKGIVKGTVVHNKTKNPLVGVNVIYGQNRGTTTNYKGEFSFETDTGKCTLHFQFIGFKPFTTSISVVANDTLLVNIELEPHINELDEIVVSVNKTAQKVADLTVSVAVLKPATIVQNHIVNAEEIVNQTYGIEVTDGQASIRGGSGYSYGAGSRVMALIDGLPVLSDDASNIRWQFLPLENLSQIEIIKGASSVLYGSSALNGIINFRTADAGIKPVTKFSVLTGIYDKPKNSDWVWWDTPRMYSSASFSFLKKSGNTDIGFGTGLLIDNGYRKRNDEKLGRINFRIKHQSKKFEALNYGLNVNAGYNLKQDFVLWENADSGALKQNQATAIELHSLFFTIDPFLTIKREERYQHDFRMRIQSSQNEYPDNEQNNSSANSVYSEYQIDYQLFQKINFILGVAGKFSKIVSEFYGDHKGYNIATYAQINYVPFQKLKLVGGIRLEQNSLDNKADNLVPIFRTGLNFQAAEATFIRASYGQGYRYPSVAEKHGYTTLGAVKIIPNTELRSESGWTTELGVKQGLLFGSIAGQADLSFFYSKNTDMIEYIFGLYPDPISQIVDFGFRATNVENSSVYGIETGFFFNLLKGRYNVNAGGGYTYIYPVEFSKITGQNTDVYLKYRRKHITKILMNAKLKKLEISLNIFYKSKILNIDDVFLDPLTRENILPGFYNYWLENNSGCFVMDACFSYELVKKLRLSFSVKNCTNTEYMGRPGDILPQRFFSLQLSGQF